jgi:predicted MFS family arabinose efflux permease
MTSSKHLSPYRWIIEILAVLALFGQTSALLAPAPILGPIIKNLNITLGEAGLIISIIALCIGIFSMLGAVVMERLGARGAMLTGIWVLAVGQILSGYSTTFPTLMACRVIEGLGYGITIGPVGAFLMQWFGEKEWPYINMTNAVGAYIGITAIFSITVPLYTALGSSWMLVLRYYGFGCAVVALAWTLLGHERKNPLVEAAAAHKMAGSSIISEVVRMRDVILLAVALFGVMWVFQLYTTFLPQYFREYRGLDLSEASALTAVLPTAGMFAALFGGLGTGFLGLRKPFLWPISILSLVGCLGAVTLVDPVMIKLALILIGVGIAGWGAAFSTLIMELPGMTPERTGTALSFIWSIGYAGAFMAPFLGGAIAGSTGLRSVMLGSLVFQVVTIVAFYLLPETGPSRARVAMVAVSESVK